MGESKVGVNGKYVTHTYIVLHTVLYASSMGKGEVIFNTMMTYGGDTVLHAILMGNDEVVLNAIMFRGTQHCMYNNVEWPELCGMGYKRVSKGVVHQLHRGEVMPHKPKHDEIIIPSKKWRWAVTIEDNG